MEVKINVDNDFLMIPVKKGVNEENIEFYLADKKIFGFNIPVDNFENNVYMFDYYASIPVKSYIGSELTIAGEFTSLFADLIKCGNNESKHVDSEIRPILHYTPEYGWCNDPNGLIYDKGLYHLYYQYNPFNVSWENMSWGHAVSKDLLHWKHEPAVLFPDEDGSMFSGCAIKNEDKIIYFYTSAGDRGWKKRDFFDQRIAVSSDGGYTLEKKNIVIGKLYKDSRDPKVFYHEKTKKYVCVLWLFDNTFGIFTSKNLRDWDKTQEIELGSAWECPDLYELTDQFGDSHWCFNSAGGQYFMGDFDGEKFTIEGDEQMAYLTEVPYAAQSFSGIEGRVISIPWLRIPNDGRNFTGSYGIPVELSAYKNNDGSVSLVQRPVREFMELLHESEEKLEASMTGINMTEGGEDKARVIKLQVDARIAFTLNDSEIVIDRMNNYLLVDGVKYSFHIDEKDMLIIVDDKIMEIFINDGRNTGCFILKNNKFSLEVTKGTNNSLLLVELS